MWLLVCSAVVLWASVQRGKLARFAPAPCMAFCGAFAPAVGICSEMQQYRARRVLWWLLGLWLRLASASCQRFGADRLGVVCPWDPRRRSRSVGASASAPGSVARSSADVLTAPDTRSGCPSVVDMVRGLLVYVFGWRRFNVLRIVTA